MDGGPADAFGARLTWGDRPVVLLVDMVMAYLEEDSPLYAGVESTLEPARRLLDTARGRGHPVIHTRVVYGPEGRDGGIFFRKVPALRAFVGETRLGAFAEPVRPTDDELVVTKQYASAFFGTSLAATLSSLRCDTVVIAGYSTSGCIRATAVDACQHGFVPVVVRDAVGDRTAAVHEANLYDLEAKYADVVGIDTAVAYLTEGPSAATA